MAYDEYWILACVQKAKEGFGTNCKKFSGSVTVEILRSALLSLGIPVSTRDVFIKGVPIEVDLLIPTRVATPDYGLMYHPGDVLAVLEVKNYGAFGEDTLKRVHRSFELIRAANPQIYCAYVTLAERRGYKWAATADNLSADVFTLFWHNGSSRNGGFESTGDWSNLVNRLKSLTGLRG